MLVTDTKEGDGGRGDRGGRRESRGLARRQSDGQDWTLDLIRHSFIPPPTPLAQPVHTYGGLPLSMGFQITIKHTPPGCAPGQPDLGLGRNWVPK
jgi:hypothetical protein